MNSLILVTSINEIERERHDNGDPNLKTKTKRGGYGEIGRRYGLNWIEP